MKLTRILTILLAALTFTMAAAAPGDKKIKPEKPDMERIKQEVRDPKSRYYYPKLMAMYEANDTVMDLNDYRHLYLGYIYQEDYNPYRHSDFSKVAEEQYYKDKHTKAECDTIIKYAELSLKDDPFDLRQINFLIYALREKQKNNIANIWQYRLNHILEAIVSTGTGLDEENAWVVINPQHEYDIINFKGYVAEAQQFAPPYYDYITIKAQDDKTPKGLYFNILYILQEYYRKHPGNS
ncbi:MAG: DUF4919 domain-containing protein [Pseudoflavonifractor sp.]|nr:DUF4919 domain-containing protein [Pseudoflavonifractor sp.]